MRILPMLMWGLACATAVEENSSSSPEHINIRLESDDPIVSRLIEEEWEVIDSTSSTTTTTMKDLTLEIPQDDVSSSADVDSNPLSIGSEGIELMKQTEQKSMNEQIDNFNTSNWWMYVLLIAFFSKIIASYVA